MVSNIIVIGKKGGLNEVEGRCLSCGNKIRWLTTYRPIAQKEESITMAKKIVPVIEDTEDEDDLDDDLLDDEEEVEVEVKRVFGKKKPVVVDEDEDDEEEEEPAPVIGKSKLGKPLGKPSKVIQVEDDEDLDDEDEYTDFEAPTSSLKKKLREATGTATKTTKQRTKGSIANPPLVHNGVTLGFRSGAAYNLAKAFLESGRMTLAELNELNTTSYSAKQYVKWFDERGLEDEYTLRGDVFILKGTEKEVVKKKKG